MPYDRDVRAFDERAASYEAGMLGLVTAAGLRSPQWHRVHAVIIQAVTAVREAR